MAKGSGARWDIGPPRDEEEGLLLADVVAQALLGERPKGETWPSDFVGRAGLENLRLVRRGGRVLGGMALLRMAQFHGGRSVPMLGVSAVAIRPEHRGSGAGSALVRSSLLEARSGRAPLAALFPATQPIYRRLGFEVAGARTRYRIACSQLALRARSLDIRPVGPADLPRLRATYLAFARRNAGLLDRTEWSWARLLSSADSTVHAQVAERGRVMEGYVVYTQRPLAGRGYDLDVREIVALTREAGESLLSFLGDHRSMTPEVTLFAAPHDPLLMMLPEPSWRIEQRWDWMLRACDVPAALEARGYASTVATQVHLDLRDDISGNAGRWRLTIGGGHAEVTRGGRGRVTLDARGLASLYSGRCSAHELQRAGLASGPDADLDALSSAFAGPAPWMAEMF